MDSQASEINARLERLERENRRMKKIGIVAIVFASVLFVSSQATTNKVVEANEFHLVDASGNVRAYLQMSAAGGPELEFYDENKTSVGIFSATSSGAHLYLGKMGAQASAALESGTSDRPAPSLALGGLTANSVLLMGGAYHTLSIFGSAGSVRLEADDNVGGPKRNI
jgi:hypothetical protein